MAFLLEWAWKSVADIKQTVDKVTVPLFDWSTTEFCDTARVALNRSCQQLKHLHTVISEMISQEIVQEERRMFHSDQKIKELRLKAHLTQLILTYVEVLIWFANAGLLPELPPPEDGSFNPFPVNDMTINYNELRAKIETKLRDWNYVDKVPSLLIDGLCGDAVRANFERDGGNGLYPPPTLRSLLISYLIHKNDDESDDFNAHRLIQYFFLDIASLMETQEEDGWNDLISESLIKFPSAFSVPPSLIKLTQAFWLLDHGEFEDAMNMLLDPLVLASDIAPWQHRSILVSFLVQDRSQMALKYTKIRQPPQKDVFDIQLHVSILLANGKVHEALQFQRKNPQMASEVMSFIFNKAEKLGKLDNILQLTLLTSEERALVQFLNEGFRSDRQEILLMFYLQRSRFQEAMVLNQRLNGVSVARKSIMARYAHRLPPNFNKPIPRNPTFQIQREFPDPTLMNVGKAGFQPTFHSGLFRDLPKSTIPIHHLATPKRKFLETPVEETPVKRMKLMTSSPQETQSVQECIAKLDEYCQKMLQTPVIERRRPSLLQSVEKPKPESRSDTPHSILKSSRSKVLFGAEVGQRTPSVSRESTPGKSLRFNVPKSLPKFELLLEEEQSPGQTGEKSNVTGETSYEETGEEGQSVSVVFADATFNKSPEKSKLGDDTIEWISAQAKQDLAQKKPEELSDVEPDNSPVASVTILTEESAAKEGLSDQTIAWIHTEAKKEAEQLTGKEMPSEVVDMPPSLVESPPQPEQEGVSDQTMRFIQDMVNKDLAQDSSEANSSVQSAPEASEDLYTTISSEKDQSVGDTTLAAIRLEAQKELAHWQENKTAIPVQSPAKSPAKDPKPYVFSPPQELATVSTKSTIAASEFEGILPSYSFNDPVKSPPESAKLKRSPRKSPLEPRQDFDEDRHFVFSPPSKTPVSKKLESEMASNFHGWVKEQQDLEKEFKAKMDSIKFTFTPAETFSPVAPSMEVVESSVDQTVTFKSRPSAPIIFGDSTLPVDPSSVQDQQQPMESIQEVANTDVPPKKRISRYGRISSDF